ncbi:uncharacterized protein LOC144914879 isoform X1 [Branchiostoma floridae x Branchiostoma belcheri]
MSKEEQQSQAGDTSATNMQRPESYWLSGADAAARIPNPMYASNAGTTPIAQPQSLRSRADTAAKIPNPMNTSNAGATRMRRPLSYWRSLANAASKMFNPMYAFSSADSPIDQPQTDYQARANDDENTPDVTYANIPDDPPIDQSQTDYKARGNDDENTHDATYASVPDHPPLDQPQTDCRARANNDENTNDVTHATITDGAYPGGASGRRGVCSFLRARRSCLAAGIAVLLSLVAVGLAPLTFSNKQEISQLSTTVKRDIRQLSATVDALKRDLDNERIRTATLEQRLQEIETTLPSCPEGHTMWRGICYKVFSTPKTFSYAAAACRADGGTLVMPRDAKTNAFLNSLYKSVQHGRGFWIGLYYRPEEGQFEWVDGSALGLYSFWGEGQPNHRGGKKRCVVTAKLMHERDRWSDSPCSDRYCFICQASPGRA